MTKDKALDLALEALEELQPDDAYPYSLQSKAITAIKQARSAPVQERKGKEYVYTLIDSLLMPPQAMAASDLRELHRQAAQMLELYAHTTPPTAQRQWVGLTDEERVDLWKATETDNRMVLIDTTEAKLKEKNNG